MRAVVNHEKYGEIVYKESFWTGRKNLSINGNALKCESKNMFSYDNGESKIIVTVFGNFVKGAKVKINDEKIQIVPNPVRSTDGKRGRHDQLFFAPPSKR